MDFLAKSIAPSALSRVSAPEIARYTESHHPHGEVISKSGVKSKFDVTKRGCSTSQNDARISD